MYKRLQLETSYTPKVPAMLKGKRINQVYTPLLKVKNCQAMYRQKLGSKVPNLSITRFVGA